MPSTTIRSSARLPWTRGPRQGSVLAMDPSTGRILTIVNQKMAFSSGFEPCSTIKPFIALAGLQEGVITRDTMIKIGHRRYMDLTEAMAHSNNDLFPGSGHAPRFRARNQYAICSVWANAPATGFRKSNRACCRDLRRCLVESPACPALAKAFGSRRCSSLRWFPLSQMAVLSISCNIRARRRLAPIFNRAYASNSISHHSSGYPRRHARGGHVRHREAQLRSGRRASPGQDRNVQR